LLRDAKRRGMRIDLFHSQASNEDHLRPGSKAGLAMAFKRPDQDRSTGIVGLNRLEVGQNG
jgi:hypothetical protein